MRNLLQREVGHMSSTRGHDRLGEESQSVFNQPQPDAQMKRMRHPKATPMMTVLSLPVKRLDSDLHPPPAGLQRRRSISLYIGSHLHDVERGFSRCNLTLGTLRSSMSPTHFQQLKMLYANEISSDMWPTGIWETWAGRGGTQSAQCVRRRSVAFLLLCVAGASCNVSHMLISCGSFLPTPQI